MNKAPREVLSQFFSTKANAISLGFEFFDGRISFQGGAVDITDIWNRSTYQVYFNYQYVNSLAISKVIVVQRNFILKIDAVAYYEDFMVSKGFGSWLSTGHFVTIQDCQSTVRHEQLSKDRSDNSPLLDHICGTW